MAAVALPPTPAVADVMPRLRPSAAAALPELAAAPAVVVAQAERDRAADARFGVVVLQIVALLFIWMALIAPLGMAILSLYAF